jgi:hypothetical protein
MTVSRISTIDHLKILNEYHNLESKIDWAEKSEKGMQCGLQYALGEDPSSSAVGKLKKFRSEKEYSEINPLFQNTIFEDIINQFNLYRTRLMWINPYSCYSIHMDVSKRIHIPLITNPSCLFIFPNVPNIVHISTGNVYIVDTTKMHSFCNFSNTPRLHLVGCIYTSSFMI